MDEGEPVQAFTAIGRIKPGEPYEGMMGAGFQATRRDVAFLKAKDAAIRPLLDDLSFTKGRPSWGYAFRRGSFEVSADDFHRIAKAMGVAGKVK